MNIINKELKAHHMAHSDGAVLLVERVGLVLIGEEVVKRDDLAVANHETLQPVLVDRGPGPLGLGVEVTEH